MINGELARMIARCSLRWASCGLSLALVVEPLYAAGLTHHGAFTQSAPQSVAPKNETQQLQPGKTAERELAGGQAHYYQITLASGDYLQVAVSQRGINVVISLWDPDGKKLAETNDPYGGRGVERVLIVAEAPGIYQLAVRAPNRDALAGLYDARIEELRPAAPRDVQRALAARLFEEGEKLRVAAKLESRRKAIEKYQAAMMHWEAAGDGVGQANTLANIGWVYRDLGEMEKPLEYYDRALALFRESSERTGEANMLNSIGVIWNMLGESQKALDYYNEAAQSWQAAGDQREHIQALINIGHVYVSLGDTQRAVEFYDRARALSMAATNPGGEALALSFLAKAYNSLGDGQRALELYGQSLQINRQLRNSTGEFSVLTSIGTVHRSMRQYDKALEIFDQVLSRMRASHSRAGVASALSEIGRVFEASGDKQKALENYNEALSIFRSLDNNRVAAGLLSEIGRIYSLLGETEKALESHKQALAIRRAVADRRAEASTLADIAQVESERENLIEARGYIEAALVLIETLRANVISSDLRASYLATVHGYYEFYTDLLMRLHQQQPAAGHAAAALQASERARARSLLETLTEARAEIRRDVDSAIIKRERSLQQQLNAKAQYQTGLLSRRHDDDEAAAIKREIEALTTDYQQVQALIREKSPRYAALMQPRPLTATEIQKMLTSDTLLLEYALGRQRSYVWAVSAESITVGELPGRVEVEAAARRVYELLTARQPLIGETETQRRARVTKADSEYPAAAQALSQMLLEPVASQLGSKRLLIVAEGALQYVPFAALPVPQANVNATSSQRAARDNGPPLIVEHEVVSVPSASVLAILRRETAGRKRAEKSVAVFADPVFDKDDDRVKLTAGLRPTPETPDKAKYAELARAIRDVGAADTGGRIPRLPFSREEAEAIVAVAPRADGMKATGFKATRARATGADLAHYQIVHFATHAFLNDRHPDLSGVVLSLVDEYGRPQDGFLRLHELYNLNLPVELVVLSACQTGLGKEIRGEGLVGLTRGFMYAGAPRVVASLWKVGDLGTAQLMSFFYRGMLKEGLRPAAALRAAQVAMWKQKRWQAPYNWAAFVLQGEWK